VRARVRLERERFDDLSHILSNPSFPRRARERFEPKPVRERFHPPRETLRLPREKLQAERVRMTEQKRLTILEVENGKCRWPVGRTKEGINQHLFCGNPVTPQPQGCKPRVYCDWHHAKAHDRKLPELKAVG
jgi:hypothetical protein